VTTTAPVRHLLLDADGVIQDLPGGWFAAMEVYAGERARELLHEAWAVERPMLTGKGGDYLPLLATTMARYGVTTPVEEVYAAIWHRMDVVESSMELVAALRAQGYGVHLATNQERRRAEHMRTVLGYDQLFDVCCYSCELGFAKPDPAFFHEAVRRIGADSSSILFVDDSEANVAGAREAGLRAEHWHFEHGHDQLLAILARHGVPAPTGP